VREAGGWVVQLGSFGEEENARRLAQRIGTYGYKPEVSNHRAGGRVMYRVRLGAYASRAQADATASSLAAHGFVAQVVAAD
jgi:DedD protein